jgi:glycosyltransferase involved in cell wall biosynthesis
MKIMIITDAWEPQINGVVRTLKQTRKELILMGHQVEMITPQEFMTFPCPTYPDISLSILPAKKVSKRIRSFKPDAIHISTEGPLGLAARSFAIKNKIPYSTAYHTRFPEYVYARTRIPLSWTYRFLRWFHGPSCAVMAPTPAIVAELQKRKFKNVVLWSRGVDLDRFQYQPSISIDTPKPIFLCVGRVAVEKNIEAFLSIDLPGSKVVIGDGPSLSILKDKYPNATYLGAKDQVDLPPYYSSADVFVFPSKTDTFGLVILEAMACGLPVAAYPVPGPIDVIGNSGAGVLKDDLREACLEALTIPKENAISHAKLYSWKSASEQFAKHLVPVPEGLVESSSDIEI